MEGEVIIYKADYIEFTINHFAGTTVLTLDNQQIRGDVLYKNGKHTSLFVSPNGATTSLSQQSGREFRLTLRLWENPEARYFWEQMKLFTQSRYSASVAFNYYPSIFTTFDSAYTANYNSAGTAEISNAIFEIKDHFADQVARGEGNVHPNEVEIVIREGAGLSLVQLPLSDGSVSNQVPCDYITLSASGSAKVDGSAIDATSTGVLLEWRFGTLATARIAPTDDPSDIANWIFVTGSMTAAQFELRIVSTIQSGGSGFSFEMGAMALAFETGAPSIAIGLTIVEGSDTSSEIVAAISVDNYDELIEVETTPPSGSHTLDLVLRWWNVCHALYVWNEDSASAKTLEQIPTVTTLTNNQHTYSVNSSTHYHQVFSNVDIREIVCPRDYLTGISFANAKNVEILALSEQFTPNSGGYYRTTYSNADDNDLPSLVVTPMTNLRELYAIACDLRANTLFLGTHPNLEIVSIDHQPVFTSSLLTELNFITSIKKLRVGNHASSGAIANPAFTMPNLEELSAPFCNLSGLISVSNRNLKVLRIDDNPGSGFNPSGFNQLEVYSALNTYSPATDLATLKEIGLGIALSPFTYTPTLATGLEKIEVENSANTQSFNFGNGLNSVSYLRVNNCSGFVAVQFQVGATCTFDYFEVSSCNFDYLGFPNNSFTRLANMTDVNGCTVILTDNALTAAEVNQILVDLDSISSGGYTGRSIDIRTNTAPDTTSGGYNGAAAKTSLQSKGFTVNTD